ncbi:hypothetical protein [Lysobacter gummosus]|uniref:hypothetical protein n=1 Tax=Lysobacter gummosus TaxID=262324 RepID=UPI003639A0CB
MKGTRVAGDVVFVPRSSGPLGDGTEQVDFSDIRFTPGKNTCLFFPRTGTSNSSLWARSKPRPASLRCLT